MQTKAPFKLSFKKFARSQTTDAEFLSSKPIFLDFTKRIITSLFIYQF